MNLYLYLELNTAARWAEGRPRLAILQIHLVYNTRTLACIHKLVKCLQIFHAANESSSVCVCVSLCPLSVSMNIAVVAPIDPIKLMAAITRQTKAQNSIKKNKKKSAMQPQRKLFYGNTVNAG